MKISLSNPPIYDQAMKLFGAGSDRVLFFTYGDTLYSPSKKIPPDDLIRHEEVHTEQQQHNDHEAEIWWGRYFVDADFRIEQEAEAYAAQFNWLCANSRRGKDRNFRASLLHQIGKLLSSEVYGKAIGQWDAMAKIRSYADNTAIKDIESHMPEAGEPEL